MCSAIWHTCVRFNDVTVRESASRVVKSFEVHTRSHSGRNARCSWRMSPVSIEICSWKEIAKHVCVHGGRRPGKWHILWQQLEPHWIWKCRRLQTVAVLGAFAKLRNASISFVMSVCLSVRLSVYLSVRMVQLCSHWKQFHEIKYLSFLRNSAEKIQVSLKSDKNNGYFTWRRFHIYDNISLNSF